MGMFDELRCKYPLPLPQYQANLFQTKSTPAQWMDTYEIREDGTLWHEDYDTEDQSERSKWMLAHPGEEVPPELKGIGAFFGCAARVNQRWEFLYFTGEIRFYNCVGSAHTGWVEFSSYFHDGLLQQLHLVEHRPT